MVIGDTYKEWDFLQHSSLAPDTQPRVSRSEAGQISNAKKAIALGRRRVESIRPFDERLRREEQASARKALHDAQRRERLRRLDRRNEDDSINFVRRIAPFHAPVPRVRDYKVTPYLEREAYLKLREGSSHFFSPAWTGPSHDSRQDLSRREGLLQPKRSSELGVGRNDLPSAGVEDQFSRSRYVDRKECLKGLAESCRAGLYTPRKVYQGRPRTDAEIRMQYPLGLPLGPVNTGASATTSIYATLPPAKKFASSLAAS